MTVVDPDEVKQTLKQVAGLVSEMVEPIRVALVEIEWARRRQIWMSAILAAMVTLNIAVLGYVFVENRKLLAVIGGVHAENRLTTTQVDQLLDLAIEHVPTARERALEIRALRALTASTSSTSTSSLGATGG